MDRLVLARNEQAEASRWLQPGDPWTN
jgi:hypothetical protein